MAESFADVEAPALLGQPVLDQIEGGVITAVVMCVEFVDPASGDRNLMTFDSNEGTLWTKVGMVDHLENWLQARYA